MIKKEYLEFLKKMILIREFENLTVKLFNQGKIGGTLHLSTGQEAIPVGVCSVLKKQDIVTAGHRANHIILAKGLKPNKLLAEMQGKKTGYCKGQGGPMHLFSKKDNFFGSNGIVSANIALSAGMALAIKQKKEKRITATFFGEGATTQGIFHETLNMASLMKLPIIFICENNLYAQSTPINKEIAVTNLTEKIKNAYKIESIKIDGNNLLEILQNFKKVADYTRKNQRPFFVEFSTYRFSGHSINDKDQLYRTKKEIELWRKKDPIIQFKNYVLKEKILTKTQIKKIESEVKKELERAILFSKNSKNPSIKDLGEEDFISN